MKTFVFTLLLFLFTALNSHAAILVFSQNGTFTTKPDLSTAATSADCAGKSIVVTSALSAVQSNISSATVHGWPTDRTLRAEPGGKINPTTKFTGLPSAGMEWFTSAQAAINAVVRGGTVYAPAGTFAVNLVVGNGVNLVGKGRAATTFTAADPTKPIILFNENNSSKYYHISGSDFSVDGQGTAVVGVKVGTLAGVTGTDAYGALSRVGITSCVDNLQLKDTVGFKIDDVYSVSASNAALLVSGNDIVTAVSISNSRFRLSKYGAYLDGGALMTFSNDVFENNTLYGVFYRRETDSGARSTTFDTCWFEGNGTGHAASAASLYLDLLDTNATSRYTSSLTFHNCLINSDAAAYNVYLNRGSEILFDHCDFDALTSAKLHFEDTGYSFAMLRQCGTVNLTASPTVYASFPALLLNAAKTVSEGFRYEYFYMGYPYTNVKSPGFYWQLTSGLGVMANITGNGATYTTADASVSSSSVVYNDGGMFDPTTGIFTATGPGAYTFRVVWPVTGFSSVMTAATVSFILNSTAYVASYDKISSFGATDLQTYTGSITLNMVAGDTVKGAISISGGVGNTASLYRGASVFSFMGRQLR